MNILVIGLGSMGKRRLRLLQQSFPEYILYGVDTQNERRHSAEKEFNISTFSNIDVAVKNNNIYAAIICTSPLSHAAIINQCLRKNLHVFTELNLVADMYTENIELANEKNLTLFLSSTFLYRDEIIYIKDIVASSKKRLNYTYHVGQYLPDWHPWEKFADFFVAEKRTNGCRELFAVELPWIIKTFGKIKDVTTIKDNISSLKLDYPDNFLVAITHETGHKGQLMVDLITRIPVRHLEIFGEDLQIEWRGKPEELYTANKSFSKMESVKLSDNIERTEGYHDFIVEDAYLKELEAFFDSCQNKIKSIYSFEKDVYTLSIIDQIEGII